MLLKCLDELAQATRSSRHNRASVEPNCLRASHSHRHYLFYIAWGTVANQRTYFGRRRTTALTIEEVAESILQWMNQQKSG
jgi:hypothetical protein